MRRPRVGAAVGPKFGSLVAALSIAMTVPATAVAAEPPAPAAGCNVELGKQVFALCSTCHALEKSAVAREGPVLNDFIGRKAGQGDPDFRYSPALMGSNWTWDAATLDRFLLNPRRALPGTTMTFIGLKSPDERAAVICYLAGARP